MKAPALSVQKAVTAAQALKRKYQEQRIKKTTVTTLSTKGEVILFPTFSLVLNEQSSSVIHIMYLCGLFPVKGAPLSRTTRSSAVPIPALSSTALSKKVAVKKTDLVSPSKKKDTSTKNDSSHKKSTKYVNYFFVTHFKEIHVL